MTRISIDIALDYDVDESTTFLFAVRPEQRPDQTVVENRLVVTPDHDLTTLRYGAEGHELFRVSASRADGLSMTMAATVDVGDRPALSDTATETPFGELSADVLPYLSPSRYCPSDRLQALALRLFGGARRGSSRVATVAEWVQHELAYEPGTTDVSTTAAEVLVGRAGVCRDYAHVMITLCRALGIPARYVAGYGVGVDPPDFHGFVEVLLDDGWRLVDPTGMTSEDQLVSISSGRDAADVAFATFVGRATLTGKTVTVADEDAA